MSSPNLNRWSSLASMAAGALLLFLFFAGSRPLGSSSLTHIAVIVPALLFIGLTGLYRLGATGLFGRVGIAIGLLGAIAMLLGSGLLVIDSSNDRGFLMWTTGALILPLGLLLFRIAALQTRSLPFWNVLPLLIGVLAGPIALLLELSASSVQSRAYTDIGWAV